jgi:ABC-type Fe3+/spermidine/putrescine transport system ATPase subunit
MISGLLPMDRAGLTTARPFGKPISYVFQNYREALFPGQAVDNIHYPLKVWASLRSAAAGREAAC